jgi:hypothetical protein
MAQTFFERLVRSGKDKAMKRRILVTLLPFVLAYAQQQESWLEISRPLPGQSSANAASRWNSPKEDPGGAVAKGGAPRPKPSYSRNRFRSISNPFGGERDGYEVRSFRSPARRTTAYLPPSRSDGRRALSCRGRRTATAAGLCGRRKRCGWKASMALGGSASGLRQSRMGR